MTERELKALLSGAPPSSRRNKYGAIHADADGVRFQSIFERGHYHDLKMREAAGEIRNLDLQVAYPLTVNGQLVCTFIADFVYEEKRGAVWHEVIEDTKSPPTRRTRGYRIKFKLMKALGKTVREVLSTSRRR